MSNSNSKKSVIAAIWANAFVMVAKFIAFAFTGSGAMLSEAIHTLADLMNQILLLVGMVRATRDSDNKFEYGYGGERYVWALISAVGIFFLGCGVTVYHGVNSLLHPPEQLHTDWTWAIVVLLVSASFEGYVLYVAVRGVKQDSEGAPFFRYLKREADPSAVAVILEDSAACLGVGIALLAILLTKITGAYYWDSIGSIVIGCLLGLIAIWLIARNHQLLVGPSIPPRIRTQILAILDANPTVEKVIDFRSRMIDNETYRIKADIRFDGSELARRKQEDLKQAYEEITNFEEFEKFVIQYSDDLIEHLGDEIDAIEEEIQRQVPKAQYLDLEAD